MALLVKGLLKINIFCITPLSINITTSTIILATYLLGSIVFVMSDRRYVFTIMTKVAKTMYFGMEDLILSLLLNTKFLFRL